MISLQRFFSPESKLGVIHTDNSSEFTKACEGLSWNHEKSTPTSIRTKWSRRKSGRNGIITVSPIRIWWTMVDRRDGMFLLFYETFKVYEQRVRQKMRQSISWVSSALWSRDVLSPNFHKTNAGFINSAQKSSQGIFRTCLEYGRRLDRRSTHAICRVLERQHCIRSLRRKIHWKKRESKA